MLRKKCRTQSLWNLHLAGDWHYASETMPLGNRPHMMRVMLISNLAVDQRFANGTQGGIGAYPPPAGPAVVRSSRFPIKADFSSGTRGLPSPRGELCLLTARSVDGK